MKPQESIDTTFSVRDAQRAPQAPSIGFREREEAVQERAHRIATRSVVRVSDPDKSTPQVLMLEVVRYRGHWRTLHNGKRSAPLADQTAAVLAAKKLARQKESEGHLVEVILRRTDGDSVTQSIDTDECCSK